MNAIGASKLLGKLKSLAGGWVRYILVAIFAVDMLGTFLPVPVLSASGPVYNVAGGVVALLLLVLFEFYESERRFAKLATKLTSQVSGSEAVIHGLKRSVDESASEARRRFTAIESDITNVGDGVAHSGESLSSLRGEVLGFRSQFEKVERAVSTMKGEVAQHTEALAKTAQAQSELRGDVDEAEGGVSEVRQGLKGLEGRFTGVEAEEGNLRTGLTGVGSSVSRLDVSIKGLRAEVSTAKSVSAVASKEVVSLERRATRLEKKVSSAESDRERIARTERNLKGLSRDIVRVKKAEAKISRMEKELSRVQAKVKPAKSRKPGVKRSKGGRTKPKHPAKREPARRVPEEVKELEPGFLQAEEARSPQMASAEVEQEEARASPAE